MSTLGEKVSRIRSKNAGPFWITIDIFCGKKEVYKDVCMNLDNSKIANLLRVKGQDLKRFDIDYFIDVGAHKGEFLSYLLKLKYKKIEKNSINIWM